MSYFLFLEFKDLAYRNPQALQSSLGPFGPLRHSGESFRWHFVHILGASIKVFF